MIRSTTQAWSRMVALAAALLTPTASVAGAQELEVFPSFDENGAIDPQDTVSLVLSREVAEAEGRLAVLVGGTDWTRFFDASPTLLGFRPDPLPLPMGESELSVHLVAPDGTWTEIARFAIVVEERPFFETSRVSPSLDANLKGQLEEGHAPEDDAPPRDPPFQDATAQAGLETEHVRGDFSLTTSVRVLGVTNQDESLRFGEEGEDAPKVDLAGYTVGIGKGAVRLEVGDVSHGSNRYLVDGFASRGLSLRLGLGSRGDVTLAAVNGNAIVGWDNFFGLDRRQHQILAGTLGLELDADRPGGLRIEASVMDGEVLPLADFNQGVVNDSEQSDGFGLRLIASDPSERLRVDGTWARSRYLNPEDDELAQGDELVPVEETKRNAVFGSAHLDVLRGVALGDSGHTLTFGVDYSYERVDPLFRSLAAYTQGDLLQHRFAGSLVLGEVALQAGHVRSEDNLDDVASILKTLTRSTDVNLSLPTSMFGSSDELPSPWAPLLTYSFNRTHQYGDGVPVDGGFNPSHIPDQISRNHNAAASWQWERFNLGYNFNYSTQDNAQPGREDDDFNTLTHALTFGFMKSDDLDLGLDLGLERAENVAEGRTDTLRRIGLNLNWRLPRGFAVTGLFSTSKNADDADTSEARNTEVDVQLAWRYAFANERGTPVLSVFTRFARQSARTLERLFDVDVDTSAWQISTGVNLSAF